VREAVIFFLSENSAWDYLVSGVQTRFQRMVRSE